MATSRPLVHQQIEVGFAVLLSVPVDCELLFWSQRALLRRARLVLSAAIGSCPIALSTLH